MRADLARREPQWLARWEQERHLRAHPGRARGRGRAPLRAARRPALPHRRHPLRHRCSTRCSRTSWSARSCMMGRAARFVPGLGLPRPAHRAAGREAGRLQGQAERRGVPHSAARPTRSSSSTSCATEFKRLGCVGLWDDALPDAVQGLRGDHRRDSWPGSRAAGLLYRAKRPVHWCVTHQTALAEAEVEYAEHTSPSIYVRFPVVPGQPAVEKLLRQDAGGAGHLDHHPLDPGRQPGGGRQPRAGLRRHPGARDRRADRVPGRGQGPGRGVPGRQRHRGPAARAAGSPVSGRSGWPACEGIRYQHPFIAEPRGERDFRLYFARHATLEAGTGLVHTAPGHGAEDYVVGRDRGPGDLRPGRRPGPLHRRGPAAGPALSVFEANPKVVDARWPSTGYLLNSRASRSATSTRTAGAARSRSSSAPPPSGSPGWASRATRSSLRAARAGGDRSHHLDPGLGPRPHPRHDRGAARLVPVAPARLGRAHPGLPLHQPAPIRRTPTCCPRPSTRWRRSSPPRGRTPGSRRPLAELLPAGHHAAPTAAARRWTRPATSSTSGSSRASPGRRWPTASWCPPGEKVDLYLEGADQHRGWFHSSLLTAVATRETRPLQGGAHPRLGARRARQGLLEVRDRRRPQGAGAKIDYIDPVVWMEKNGAELLRLWTAAGDYQSDIVFSKTILDQLGESYRKIRNTCRYLLSNLYDFVPARDAPARRPAARAGPAGAGRAARARPPGLRGLPPLQLPRGGAPDWSTTS